MTTRPNTTTDPLNWADGGSADVVDPGVAKQAVGWVDFEPVNNGHVNEMMRRWGEFLIYLDSIRSGQRPYVYGKDAEGVPTFSATTLEVSFAAGFSVNYQGYQFVIDASDTVFVVPDPVNPALHILYVNTSGVLAVAVGPYIGGIAYEPSPWPDGVILYVFKTAGAAVNLAGTAAASTTVDYRDRSPNAPFRLLHEAYGAMAHRETHECWFRDEDRGEPHDLIDPMNSVTTIVGSGQGSSQMKGTVAVTGRSVICSGKLAVDPKRFHPDFRTLLTTYALVGAKAGGTRKIVTDGKQVCVIQSTFCELFDIDGTHKWSYNHNAILYDVHMTENSVYICGVTNAVPETVVKINKGTGVKSWGYNHNADVASVWSDEVAVHFDGDPSGHASGATFRIIDSSGGFDVANEGGTGLSTSGRAGDVVQAGNSFKRYKFVEAPDGQVYRHRGALNNIIEEHGRRFDDPAAPLLPTARVLVLTASNFTAIAVDQDYIIMGEDNRIAYVSRDSLTVETSSYAGAGEIVYGVATDGQRVYIDGGPVGNSVIVSVVRGNRAPTRYMKFDDDSSVQHKNFKRRSMIPAGR